MTIIDKTFTSLAAAFACATAIAAPAHAWEPRKPVELLVPAGAGGSSDQFARVIQSIIVKYDLMEEPLVVTIKSGANGAEGYMAARAANRDPHTLIIGTSQVFSYKVNAGLPLDYTEYTPVAMLAEDQFGLWVPTDSPYETPAAFVEALGEAAPGTIKMGGTGSKSDDHLLAAKLDQVSGGRLAYIPYKGGGEAATQLVGHHVAANVNNPGENMAQWRAGQLKALCLFGGERLPYEAKVAGDLAWSDIPTCSESGIDHAYTLPRGILAGKGIDAEVAAYYEDMFRKVSETPEFAAYLEANAMTPSFKPGAEFGAELTVRHEAFLGQMTAAGFATN